MKRIGIDKRTVKLKDSLIFNTMWLHFKGKSYFKKVNNLLFIYEKD